MIAATKKRTRRAKCQCVTRWFVDFQDKRGVCETTPTVAALASGVGLPVMLKSTSKVGLRPIGVAGLSYSGDKEYVSKYCDVCGWPVQYKDV